MNVLISAAEASSDQHAALILKALKKKVPGLKAFGVGGKRLEEAGLEIVVSSETLLAMGFSEILSRLPKIFLGLRRITQIARQRKPDFAILVDYPGFHFRLAKRLKRMGVKVFYFIPPKVWVWRENRVRFLKLYFDHLFCIFPFEIPFYSERGVAATYVGNPVVESLSDQALKGPGTSHDGVRQLALLPGSRPSEIHYHLPLFLSGAIRMMQTGPFKSLKVCIPCASTIRQEMLVQQIDLWKKSLSSQDEEVLKDMEIELTQERSQSVLAKSDLGLIKSGTSTLEAAFFGLPHVIAFKTSRLSHFIFDYLIRYRGPIGLSNLLAMRTSSDRLYFQELLGKEVTPERLAEELLNLAPSSKSKRLIRNMEGIQNVRKSLLQEEKPSERMANQLLEVLRALEGDSKRVAQYLAKKPPREVKYSGTLTKLLSFIWSTLNWFNHGVNRLRKKARGNRSYKVVSVGNLQAGGAGKTPLVLKIAEEAIQKGLSVAILLRGYRGAAEKTGELIFPYQANVSAFEVGDEAALIHQILPQVWLGVGKNRRKNLDELLVKTNRKLDLIILDDGFQNYQLEKDVEILALTQLDTSETVFRDHWAQAKYADLIVWTKGKNTKRQLNHPREIEAQYRLNFGKFPRSEKVILVTGIGMGKALCRELCENKVNIWKHYCFDDHHFYQAHEINALIREGITSGSEIWLTFKDWVKWKEILKVSKQPRMIQIIEFTVEFVHPKQAHKIWDEVVWSEQSV